MRLFLQYADAVGLRWGADTMPVKQQHNHHGRRILRITNCTEGNGKPPRLIYRKTWHDGTSCQKPAEYYSEWVTDEMTDWGQWLRQLHCVSLTFCRRRSSLSPSKWQRSLKRQRNCCNHPMSHLHDRYNHNPLSVTTSQLIPHITLSQPYPVRHSTVWFKLLNVFSYSYSYS